MIDDVEIGELAAEMLNLAGDKLKTGPQYLLLLGYLNQSISDVIQESCRKL